MSLEEEADPRTAVKAHPAAAHGWSEYWSGHPAALDSYAFSALEVWEQSVFPSFQLHFSLARG